MPQKATTLTMKVERNPTGRLGILVAFTVEGIEMSTCLGADYAEAVASRLRECVEELRALEADAPPA